MYEHEVDHRLIPTIFILIKFYISIFDSIAVKAKLCVKNVLTLTNWEYYTWILHNTTAQRYGNLESSDFEPHGLLRKERGGGASDIDWISHSPYCDTGSKHLTPHCTLRLAELNFPMPRVIHLSVFCPHKVFSNIISDPSHIKK